MQITELGLALIMAILADPAAEHPPLEILFTSSEEAGMKGAWSLVESRPKIHLQDINQS